ncbi:MAG: hypothetical protein A2X64_06405 [Ignavibacteria bacterium GWF2_33_9]|nr:MAG: hypothetical protein A2X64_06405 [Ignavibacteria bacterium GWF2_33_9]
MNPELQNLSDIELLDFLKSEDKSISDAAFREIYNKYASRVHSYCYKILKDRQKAEDIFQETFIKFYNNVQAERLMNGGLIGFIITIARNLCLNEKRNIQDIVSFNSVMYYQKSEIYNNFEDTKKYIQDAINKLEFAYKEPLVLRLYDGMEYSEIAEICGISELNARKRVFRAKQKIKEYLKPIYIELFN